MEAKERIYEAIETARLVSYCFGEEVVPKWLNSPQKDSGKTPIDILTEGSIEDIRKLQGPLWGLVNGDFS